MSTSPRVLLLGGHGKVALKLTSLLLSKSWSVTSVIRNPEHESEINELASNKPGKLNVLVESLDNVKSDADASKVLDKVDPQIVVWSAGAGGKGGKERTYAIDQDAAKHYINASISRPSVQKFLLVSYLASRRGNPPWWNEEDIKAAEHVNTKVLPDYFKAKVEADEHLVAVGHKREQTDKTFQWINLRPGTLTDDEPTGKVTLGKTSSRGGVPRGDVAAVAAALLDRNDTKGYYDLLKGDEPIETAVDNLVKEGHDGLAGEDLERIYARA